MVRVLSAAAAVPAVKATVASVTAAAVFKLGEVVFANIALFSKVVRGASAGSGRMPKAHFLRQHDLVQVQWVFLSNTIGVTPQRVVGYHN